MKKSIVVLTALAGLFFASCQNFKKGEGGLEYKYIKDGGAEKAVGGDILALDMIVETDRDSLLGSTYDLGMSQIAPIYPDSLMQGGYPGDNNTMLKMLGEGDSAVFRLNLDTMAARTGQPKPDIADKYIQFTVKVKKHFKKGNLTDSALFEQVNKFYLAETENLKKAEQGKITSYVEKNKLTPKKTASGLQYVIKAEGSGNSPVVGDTVVLNYTGSLTTGKMFDTNNPETAKKEKIHQPMRPYEPLRVRIGHTPVIPGWTEGLQLLKKGSKATFIIPSSLGYGERAQGNMIPAYAPLVFDVDVLEIIPGPKEEPTPAQPTIPVPTP
ncbi:MULTISPECIES: FKBP-type peptidyl-prolyl cis-trans isomerase [Sphingobacterium]|uniref:peptidylprolyl isomerase n=1 Tax=Sphingobacterium tenebrionis TaxID=3111775 RepID=A0ABU8I7L9_9SPHI|nr:MULTISPECIES: FKBP-type peptidyl-prolyl cis-trans isomerase [unclassified Sphingobacterium]QBR10980.1 peptidylprolyl isomerase [Sphingobacterium sp. CZ-2]